MPRDMAGIPRPNSDLHPINHRNPGLKKPRSLYLRYKRVAVYTSFVAPVLEEAHTAHRTCFR